MAATRLPLAILVNLALATAPVLAQSDASTGDWSLRLGGAALVVPSYEGSDSAAVRPVPLVDLQWRDLVFLDSRRGLGANLIRVDDPRGRGSLKIGPFANWRFARKEGDDDDLRGLGDVKGGVDVGAFAQYSLGRIDLNLTGKRNASDRDLGGTVEFGARYRLAPIGRTMVSFGPSVTWADSDYMKSYFGVAADKVLASGLAAYVPSAGVKDVGIGVLAVHPFAGNWALSGFGGYTRLVGDAADSPLVKQRGSANQLSFGLGLSYKFR
jgi:outer membrane scaffolding protein for murein synthesis (MipA/OmpV family)